MGQTRNKLVAYSLCTLSVPYLYGILYTYLILLYTCFLTTKINLKLFFKAKTLIISTLYLISWKFIPLDKK